MTSAAALNHQGILLAQRGQLSQAIATFKKALKLAPSLSDAYCNLGVTLKQQGKLALAITALQKALALNPNSAFIPYNLGNAYQASHNLSQAKHYYLQSLAIDPTPATHNNLGLVYQAMHEHRQAIKHFRASLELSPQNSETLLNLGTTYLQMQNLKSARHNYLQATSLDSQNPRALHELGYLLYLEGRLDSALEYLQAAIKLDPQNTTMYTDLLLLQMELCNWDEVAKLESLLTHRHLYITPFVSVAAWENNRQNFQAAKAVSQNLADQAAHLGIVFPFSKHRRSTARIRLGYLSSDFRDHATAHLVLDLFKLHDRRLFQVFVYSYGPDDGSSYRRQIMHDSDHFVDLKDFSLVDSAKRIHADKIDILIDLKGHTLNNRLAICALRPAPIQISYLGFPGTLGADFIDYALVDKIVVPSNHAKYYSEILLYLPHTYQITSPKPLSTQKYTRRDFGLPDSSFVFCSFNSSYKIDPVMFAVWMNILRKVPNSILWLMEKHLLTTTNLRAAAKQSGIDPSRLIFASKLERADHLLRHQLADLALDTRIYNGHTTTSDALWAGVPVITLQGKHFASRVAASLLTAAGLPETITHSLKAYKNLAVQLATHPAKLARLKSYLNFHKQTTPLFDTPSFVTHLEKAYTTIWNTYQTNHS